MFRIFSGTMGGGKSYAAVEEAISFFQKGRRVMSNLDWNEAEMMARKVQIGENEFSYRERHITLGDEPMHWREKMIGADEGSENLMVIDEGAMMLHAWDQSRHDEWKRELFAIIAMTRKLGIELVIISQAASNLDAGLRKMAAFEIYCVAVKKVPVIGPWAAMLLGDFKRSVLNQRRQVLSSSYHRYSPKVGTLYQTDALKGAALLIKREEGGGRIRKKDVVRAPLWLKLLVIAMASGMVWGVMYLREYWGKRHEPATPVPVTAPAAQPTTPAAKSPLPTGPGHVDDGPQMVGYEPVALVDSASEILAASCWSLNIGRCYVETRDGTRYSVGHLTPDGRRVTSLSREPLGAGYMYVVEFSKGKPVLVRPLNYKERLALFDAWKVLHPAPASAVASAESQHPPSPSESPGASVSSRPLWLRHMDEAHR